MPSEEVSNTKKRKFLIVSLGFTLPRQDSSEIVINLLKNFYQAVVCVIFCGITKSIVERDYEMEYAVGKPGRIFAVRLFEGEDLYESIEGLAEKEDIKSAAVLITGGFRKANVVVGPKQEKPKIVGNFKDFAGPGEVLGVGTIYRDEQGPKMHLHSAIGKGDETVVGCPRGGAKVFLILEVTIIEIEGIQAGRRLDKDTGLNLLTFK